jgi:cyclohexadieny/prephenate dehydrogenase
VSGPAFERVAVIGLGLLGGSVAAAVRERGVARRVVGVARLRETAAAAVRDGVADEAGTELERLVAGADLVVLATPIGAMAPLLGRAAASLSEGCVVTDVGSIKGALGDTLPGLLPPGVAYVGAHPMTGSHRRGLDHARADLFEGSVCIVAPGRSAPAAAVARVRAFFEALGARVVLRDPARHDEEVAWVSHLPHALAFAYARALAEAPAEAAAVRGSGFRDFSRIAWSDPELWAEILCANRKALAGPLALAAARLAELARAVEQGDGEAVERFLAAARDALARFADDARSGGDHPEIPARKEH